MSGSQSTPNSFTRARQGVQDEQNPFEDVQIEDSPLESSSSVKPSMKKPAISVATGPNKHVQWRKEGDVSDIHLPLRAPHTVIDVDYLPSPRTLADQGGNDMLAERLKEEELRRRRNTARDEEKRHSPSIREEKRRSLDDMLDLRPSSETIRDVNAHVPYDDESAPGSKRATMYLDDESVDGEAVPDRQEIIENMDVYVNPHETDGLPGQGESANQKAEHLVRAYTMGPRFLRKRNNKKRTPSGGRRASPPEEIEMLEKNAEPEPPLQRSASHRVATFFRDVFNHTPATETYTELDRNFDSMPTHENSGILSALIALNNNDSAGISPGASLSATPGLSTATTPSASGAATPVSIASSISDEEKERVSRNTAANEGERSARPPTAARSRPRRPASRDRFSQMFRKEKHLAESNKIDEGGEEDEGEEEGAEETGSVASVTPNADTGTFNQNSRVHSEDNLLSKNFSHKHRTSSGDSLLSFMNPSPRFQASPDEHGRFKLDNASLTASGRKKPHYKIMGGNLSLGSLPKFNLNGSRSTDSSPFLRSQNPFDDQDNHEKERRKQQQKMESAARKKRAREEKKRREERKLQKIFITRHVAALMARQEFLLKLARAFMMYGAPTHRLEAQIQATARVLEINCQAVYLPGVMLISFGDYATHTSEVKFLKQTSGLDLGKLLTAYFIYYSVIHDHISVSDANVDLDGLMVSKPIYKSWQNVIIGGFASAFIQPSAFYGSFIDCLAAIPLGALLVLVQILVSRNDLYSSLFEIVVAFMNAFLAAALASTKQFCFSAVASGSVVLILPGYIVLCGALELANRCMISGSVRLVYSILYSLFLGFGLSMGSIVYVNVTGLSIAGATDYTCAALRENAPWYRATISPYFYFLTVPCFLLMLALRNGQPLLRKETVIMLLVGSAGFCANYFSGKVFTNRADVTSAIGSFIVGFLGNIYGKFVHGSSPFIVMVPGVLIQLPSGLSHGGLLQFASNSVTSGSDSSYSSGFTTATSLIEVAIGLTVGLFVSTAVTNIFGGGRRRGSYLFSF